MAGIPSATVASARGPELRGTIKLGGDLTTTDGSWERGPASYTYRWLRCAPDGADCAPIAGARNRRYTIVRADVGHTIRSAVTAHLGPRAKVATRSAGRRGASASAAKAQQVTVISASTAVVADKAPRFSSAPLLTGTAAQGSTLKASVGTGLTQPAHYAYRWEDCDVAGADCSAISGVRPTATSYQLRASDVGDTVRVEVQASNSAGAASATSAATSVVVPPAPVNSVAPSISGVAQPGQTLTASPGTWSNSPTHYAYQWEDCSTSGGSCAAITDATSPTYLLVASDLGHTIVVTVRATNAAGSTSSSSSTATAVVTSTSTSVVTSPVSGSSGSCSGSEMCAELPATSTAFDDSMGAQDMQLESPSNDGPAPSGSPSVSQLLTNLDLKGWRMLPTSPTGNTPSEIVAPSNYYLNIGGWVDHELSWQFASIDKQLAETPATVPRLIQQDPSFPLWYCPNGSWTNSSTGCTFSGPAGLQDPSYAQLAGFYAGMVAYYTTGVIASGSGTTSYTADTLTDTGHSFAGEAGDCVTATVIDAWGYPDWVTGTIASVSGDSATLTGDWSTSESWDTNSNTSASGNITSSTPAPGAAYNLASCTPPSGPGYDLASPTAATPWPVPPSVVTPATINNINFEVPVNEPDLNSILGNTYPSAPSPTPTLTGENVAGGTLTPGVTYTYSIAGAGDEGRQNVPGATASIQLPAGDNAVRISWAPTTNHDMPTFAYVIYGRMSGIQLGLAAVGEDAGSAWVDKGTVTPSGSPQTSDQSANEAFDTPGVNAAIWNVIAPAMRAVDSTVGLVGPAIANPTAVYGPWGSVDVNCATTSGIASACANGDGGWLSTKDYIPMLLDNATVKPTAVSMHAYGTSSGSITPESSDFSSISGWAIPEFDATDKAAVDAANVPVWITEANVDADYEGSPTAGTSYRSATQMGSAWMAADFLDWGKADPLIQKLFDFASDGANASFMLYGKSNESGNTTCVPQPACTHIRPEQPTLQYWSIYEMQHLLGAGGKLVTLTHVPAGFEATAVQTGAHTLVVAVVNEQQGSDNGNGAPGSFQMQVQGASVTDVQDTVINGNTSMANGPTTTDLGTESHVQINAAGYEVDLLKYTLQ